MAAGIGVRIRNAALCGLALAAALGVRTARAEDGGMRYAIAIHGGAGTITRQSMTAERERAYRAKLAEALEAGRNVLAAGGSALDAVEAAIVVMEDSPLFNAGKGAVFTADGRNELDASIMDGRTLNAGAVAAVTHVKNPIRLARLVMERSPHVLLAGDGAEAFAREVGAELVPATYFWTERRWQQLMRVQEEKKGAGLLLDHDAEHKYGTVGAVALDKDGNLAAGTSTGGLTNKAWGRIGDSPIIGAGTYASNASCAVSGTGQGEYFIRLTIAREVCALVEHRKLPLQRAADEVIQNRLKNLGGSGGVIALGRDGAIAFSFNTEGMYRGWLTSADPEPHTAIYKD
ncbi:MAG: isoaspartyl peptidase/L-asparaginase [Rhodothalassiaceae bacterium]|nr:MAG: isoaspartyl peptidase/L-asparaginase [Rhodothalassiaceae bacterium]